MFAFIGAGKVGSALGAYFQGNGIEIIGYFSKSIDSAVKASSRTGSRVFEDLKDIIDNSQFIWITTPDDVISEVAEEIARLEITGQKSFIHASGFLTTKVLKPLKDKGHKTYSIHPLLAFNNVESAVKMLPETTFFIETEEQNLDEIKAFFHKTKNRLIQIDKEQKPAYHVAAAVLSNYLVTLFHTANQLFELAGINKEELDKATTILVESVLENLQNKTTKDALTGPIKRGDKETVKKHLKVLEQNLPELTELYKVLGRETMKMIGDFRLKKTLK